MYRSLTVLLFAGCATEGSAPIDPPPSNVLPRTSGSYVGSYRVPTVTSELEPAATFFMDSVDWTVAGDTVTFHYDLPLGLVGGEIEVTLTGTLSPDATTIEIAGANATGSCTRTDSVVSCREVFMNLGTLPISMDVVEARAPLEYTGPVAHRIAVATKFGSDPIGVADFDLTMPEIENETD